MSTSNVQSTGAGQVNQFSPKNIRVEGNNIFVDRYRIEYKEGEVIVHDTRTGQWVKAHGDPHFHTSDGDKGQFHTQNLTLDLANGVKITIKPTAPNAEGISLVDSVAVMQKGEAIVVRGMSDGQNGQLVSQVLNNAGGVDAEFDDGTVLRLANENNLDDLIFAATGVEFQGGDSAARWGEKMLDGIGGRSIYDYAANAGREQAGYIAPTNIQGASTAGSADIWGGARVPVDQRPEYKPMFAALNSARGEVDRLNKELAATTDPDKRKEILIKLQEAKQDVSFILNMITNLLKQEQDDRLAIVRNLRSN